MLVIISDGDNVVATRVEADGVVPGRFLVIGANSPHALDSLGIVRDDKVGCNAGNVT